MTLKKRKPMQLTTFRLDEGMKDTLKQVAEVEGIKYQPLVRRIIREWLKDWYTRHLDKLR
jgi:predicted DNA binding CopG/RHH family protein